MSSGLARPISLRVSFWNELACDILAIAGRSRARTSVLIKADLFMRQLEKKHLGRIKLPVSVLSFPVAQGLPGATDPEYLGEVFLNRDYLKQVPPAYAVRLLIHGILHLLGYRHERARDTIKMEAKEARIQSRLSRVLIAQSRSRSLPKVRTKKR